MEDKKFIELLRRGLKRESFADLDREISIAKSNVWKKIELEQQNSKPVSALSWLQVLSFTAVAVFVVGIIVIGSSNSVTPALKGGAVSTESSTETPNETPNETLVGTAANSQFGLSNANEIIPQAEQSAPKTVQATNSEIDSTLALLDESLAELDGYTFAETADFVID